MNPTPERRAVDVRGALKAMGLLLLLVFVVCVCIILVASTINTIGDL